jgi:predicted DNA-binding protein
MSDKTIEQPEPTWFRLTRSEKKRLEAIAAREGRTLANIIARWVRERMEQAEQAQVTK